eukprot:TRINITY_DN14109_c0_g1_i1.p1 TRINITY_DN14109_c0_g1~~TRINITY_DN14109_c0_g1_i1.p1  ORF type:complete len:389 (+),score=58.34 TRINITY_DN14109_c0_g1_i1:76-1167(+)
MAILGLDTPYKKFLFLGYMSLWSALRLLIYGSKKFGPAYDPTTLLVFVCFAKLGIAVGMFLRQDGGWGDLWTAVTTNNGLFLRYFLPAASYVVYDNLTFINLTYADPVTYVILMQMRLAATGLMWSISFGKHLNINQWGAVLLLTIACLLQKLHSITDGGESSNQTTILSVGLISAQIAFGVFSSVFNEVLLKEKGTATVNVQNVFMYTHSIVCNIFWLAVCPSGWCKRSLSEATSSVEVAKMADPWVIPIIVILASIGIVTSLFIKNLDSVRKTIASAIEIFIDTFLSFVLFGIPVGANTVLATLFAAGGILLYSKPVKKPDEDHIEGSVPDEGSNRKIFSMSELLKREANKGNATTGTNNC